MSDLDRVLAALDPIILADMDGVSLMNRVDTKYVFSQHDLAAILSAIAPDYRVLEVEALRRTKYTSLYFDTPGRDCFRDHHNGKSQRFKFRMRRYASSGVSFFEVKQKTNRGRTIKRRLPIDRIHPTLTPDTHGLVTDCVGAPVALTAQLWTEFSRITLVARDAAERVTIDADLSFTAGPRRESLPGVVVAEVKQERDCRDSAIRRRLRGRGVRPLRVSKYCLGATLLTPTLKSNLFRAKLKTLRKYA